MAEIKKPVIKLSGENGNVFNLLAIARKALLNAGYSKKYINDFTEKATSGDYYHALSVISDYCEVR